MIARIGRTMRKAAHMSENPFTITGIDLTGYGVGDSARAVAFYRDVLGLEPTRMYPEDRSLGRRRRRDAVPTEQRDLVCSRRYRSGSRRRPGARNTGDHAA